MSVPFVCGMKKYAKHKVMPADRPSNTALQRENETYLSMMIRMREEQDKGMFKPVPLPEMKPLMPLLSSSTSDAPEYTPWKTPSTTY